MGNNSLTIIDLINEAGTSLRRENEERWRRDSEIKIATTEWLILMKAYNAELTISQLARVVNATRQGIHKSIGQMRDKGLIEVYKKEDNRRDKFVRPTVVGRECHEKNMRIKYGMEQEILQKIGSKEMADLKLGLSKELVQQSGGQPK